MSKITGIIPSGSSELIRDRIAVLLIDEIENQVNLVGSTMFPINAFVERISPIDKSELDCINILYLGSLFDNYDVKQSDGLHRYTIDCYVTAKSTDEGGWEELSNFKLQKLLHVCRSILKASYYVTLGFERPFIMNTKVESVQIMEPKNSQDSFNVSMGRIVFVVRVPDAVETITPNNIAGFSSRATLSDSGKGYLFSGDTVFVPPPSCAPVLIIDSETLETIAEVPGGESYPVLVFSGIKDNGPPYSNSIVAIP